MVTGSLGPVHASACPAAAEALHCAIGVPQAYPLQKLLLQLGSDAETLRFSLLEGGFRRKPTFLLVGPLFLSETFRSLVVANTDGVQAYTETAEDPEKTAVLRKKAAFLAKDPVSIRGAVQIDQNRADAVDLGGVERRTGPAVQQALLKLPEKPLCPFGRPTCYGKKQDAEAASGEGDGKGG